MFKRTVSPEDLARLHDERKAADRVYNEALTALDAVLQQVRNMPHAPPAYDDRRLARLAELRDPLAPTKPDPGGWRGRAQAFARRLAAPLLEGQQAFNATLVDHLERNAGMHREVPRAVASSLALVREELERLIHFQHRLIQFAQQITPYVDTKDREVSGLMRRINEDVAQLAAGIMAGLSGLSDELDTWRQVIASLKRDLARLRMRPAAPAGAGSAPPAAAPEPAAPLAGADDAYKYVGFENRFRGSTDEIRARVAAYLPYFEDTADVLDAGCGRGEFLALLQERGIAATGVDVNPEMVELCRARGLAVVQGDLLAHLAALDDGALGGLFAAQVVEHLEPARLLAFIDAAFLKLRPGAPLVLETINVASWSAFFQSYVRDITHARPLHPDTLDYLVRAAGFRKVRVVYRSPCPEEDRLRPVEAPAAGASAENETAASLARMAKVLNHNTETLNRLLFADRDYAVVAERADSD